MTEIAIFFLKLHRYLFCLNDSTKHYTLSIWNQFQFTKMYNRIRYIYMIIYNDEKKIQKKVLLSPFQCSKQNHSRQEGPARPLPPEGNKCFFLLQFHSHWKPHAPRWLVCRGQRQPAVSCSAAALYAAFVLLRDFWSLLFTTSIFWSLISLVVCITKSWTAFTALSPASLTTAMFFTKALNSW